jgi:rubrerythrin
MRYKTVTLLFLVLLAPVHSLAARDDGKSGEAKSADAQLVILRGRVNCIDDSCDGVSHRYEFTTQGGERYTFVEGDELAAIFHDARVRSRELQISARLHAKLRLEIIKVKSVVNGRTNDLYYFCEVCNITAYAPGPCPCCRNELEFIEKPLP